MAETLEERKKRLAEVVKEQINPTISEEDKKTPASNFRNYTVEKLGLPESWKMSVADTKEWEAGAPAMMAGAAMGSVGKAAKIVNNMKVANIVDETVKGSKLIGQPVFATAAEKTADLAKNSGKVLTPDMPKATKMTDELRSVVDTMMQKFKHLKQTDPAQYQAYKQERVNFVLKNSDKLATK